MDLLLASISYDPVQRWGPVSPHGVGTAVGFFLGAWLMARRAEPNGIPKSEVYNAVTWGAVGAIIGARGFYVLGHLSEFGSVRDVLAVWEGGLTMFGGFIGGLALGLAYLKRHGFSIPVALDAAAPGFVVGVMFGRIGDIIIADHLGQPTNFVFGYEIPLGAPIAPGYGPPIYVPGAVVHHTAIYDLIGTLVLFGFLFWLQRRPRKVGTLFAAFSIWYGLQRVLVDFTRNREQIEAVFAGLSGSQWAGIAFALGGAVALYRISRRPETPRADPVPAPVHAEPEWPQASEPEAPSSPRPSD
ncbi:MAG: prolipoprotein diacylglyceryl transferase family protein [Actinomycetota bacterium]